MHNGGLGGIIGSLHLGEIDHVATHGSSSNETTVGEIGDFLAVYIRTFFLLATPVARGGLGAVESAVEVNADDTAVVLERTLNHGTLGPRDTGVGDEHVEAAIEVLDNGIGGGLNGLRGRDLDLVSLGCKQSKLDLSIGRKCSGHTHSEHRTSQQSQRHAR